MIKLDTELLKTDKKSSIFLGIGLVLYFVYIFVGNFSRLIKLSFIPRSISIVEICIVIFVGFYIIYQIILFMKYKRQSCSFKIEIIEPFEILLILMLISIFINMIFYKFTLIPLLYYIRFFSLICFSSMIYLFLEKVNNIHKIELHYIAVGVVLSLIGWIIYIIQPDTEVLNKYFESKGIFLGLDPHKFRLIGNVLDPNFFGNILIIFIAITFISIINTDISHKKEIIIKFGAIILYEITLLKTLSRSSLLGFVLAIFINSVIILLWSVKTHKEQILKKIFAIDLFLMVVVLVNKDFYRIFQRVKEIPVDNSAKARFQGWNQGFSILHGNPIKWIIGDGYGFLNEKYGLGFVGFDSSLLNIILYCGVVGSAIFMIFLFKKLVKTYRTSKKESISFKLHFVNLCSLFITFAMISWFNNLLFYQYWIVVFLPYYFLITNWQERRRDEYRFGCKTT